MFRRLRQMQATFGASFLWLICVIYFTQGFRSFVWTAVSYLLKDRLKLSPSASQFITSVAFFPWSIKPCYGIISDCIPIRGRKRIPYLVIATILSLIPWLILGSNLALRSSSGHLTMFLTVQNLGSAMADVVIDAMIAEAVRFDGGTFSGDLQSMSWLAMSVGGICGSLFGGYSLSAMQIDKIFLLFSLLPTIQLLSCGLVEESYVIAKAAPNHFDSKSSNLLNGNGHASDESIGFAVNSRPHTFRRTKSRKKRSNPAVVSSKPQVLKRDGLLVLQWLNSLKFAFNSLCRAFTQPAILRPMAWFFLAQITIPNISTVMFYYQTEVLKLEASFLGTARVIGWLGLMVGTFTYNRYLKNMNLRKILLCAHIGLSILNLLDIVLVSRLNVTYNISDKIMVLCGSALADAVNQLKFMPFLILSGQLCPPGIEGTLFALFMSINNFGSTVGSFLGAGLASVLNISSGSFDNLQMGISIQTICTFIPVGFLFLIPKEATGIAA